MLYIVATPIGNLKEITYYAIETLKKVDYVACEDTRTSAVLLNHYGINKPLVSYHKFNERSMLSKVVKDLEEGKEVALISDAGMPGVSDPGNILVNELIEKELPYTVISGPSALINAFVMSGFPSPFTFIGFLPKKSGEAKKILKEYVDYKTTLIFYLSPHNINDDIKMLYSVLGDRKICVVREISKKFEEKVFSTLSAGYNGVEKGEFVLVVEGAVTEKSSGLSIMEQYENLIESGVSKNDAIKQVAKENNLKKNDVYQQVLHSTMQ